MADRPAGRLFNESHWSNPDRAEVMSNYNISKTLAEKAAWDFVAALPEDQKFELVVINPSFVMGPPLRKESFTSGEFLAKVIEGRMPQVTGDHLCAVDVRDVGFAHLQAIKVTEAANRRFILSHFTPSF